MNTTHHGPPLAQDAFYLPIPGCPADYAKVHRGGLRQAVEAQIERLISFLDWIDLDPDMEPSLGFSEGTYQARTLGGANDDLEFACEDEGAQCDDEGAEA